eukprot:746304-Hanusia_phi.AAC.3
MARIPRASRASTILGVQRLRSSSRRARGAACLALPRLPRKPRSGRIRTRSAAHAQAAGPSRALARASACNVRGRADRSRCGPRCRPARSS